MRGIPRDVLFFNTSIHDEIARQKQLLDQAIRSVDEQHLRQVSLDQLADEMARNLTVTVPQLRESEISVSRPREIDIQLDQHQQFDYGFTTRTAKGSSITYTVPFTGNQDLFRIRPSSFTTNPPRAELLNGRLEVTFSGLKLEAAALKAQFEAFLKSVRENLATLTKDFGAHNASLKQLAYSGLSARLQALQRDDDLVSGLGYKVR